MHQIVKKLHQVVRIAGSAARYFYCAKVNKKERNAGLDGFEEKKPVGRDEGQDVRNVPNKPRPTSNRNSHPTVKPIALMEHLVKMITPEGGTVLDPFMGSGSTGCAAVKNDFDFIGIDLSLEYIGIAEARIMHWKDKI